MNFPGIRQGNPLQQPSAESHEVTPAQPAIDQPASQQPVGPQGMYRHPYVSPTLKKEAILS